MHILSRSETESFEACMKSVKIKSGQDTFSMESIAAHLSDLYYEKRVRAFSSKPECQAISIELIEMNFCESIILSRKKSPKRISLPISHMSVRYV